MTHPKLESLKVGNSLISVGIFGLDFSIDIVTGRDGRLS